MIKRNNEINVETRLANIQKFTVIYVLLAGPWLLFSNTLLGWFSSDIATYVKLQTYAAWFIVLATGLLFYFYLRPQVEEIKRSHNALLEIKEELHENERKLREVQKMAHFGYWNWNVKTGEVEWSDEVYKIFHLNSEEFVPQIDSILALSPWPEDHLRNEELIDRALKSHDLGSYEQKFLRPDNSIGYYYSTFQGKYDISGDLISIVGTVLDITEQKNVETDLKRSQKLLNETQRLSKIGGWEFDPITKKTIWTDEVYMIHEVSKDYDPIDFDQYIGFYASEDREKLTSAFRQVVENGIPYDLELQFITAKGKEMWVRTMADAEFDNGKVIRVSGNIMDITEKKTAELSLLKAKIMAEDNSRIKSEFLANMSHELRTPLTAILGFSDVLRTDPYEKLNEKQFQYVDNIYKSSIRLREIIDRILDISRMDSGKMELNVTRFQASEVLDEIRDSLLPLAGKKGIDMDIVNNIKTKEILADKLKFKQIMFNLLQNAIKFTPEGGKISVFIDRKNNHIQVSVSDTGIGIPQDVQEDIFNPFMQVDSSSKRKYGGTGLGLFLVKQFVEMHDGRIWVESEGGKGSTFTFTIGKQDFVNSEKITRSVQTAQRSRI